MHPDSQLDMPSFIWLFASSSQLLYEHFALTQSCFSTSFLYFPFLSFFCKSFLRPTKGLNFSCQQTFFSLSLSQQTLPNPPANVFALKDVVCHYLLIPLLSLSCAALFPPSSSSSSFFNLCTNLFKTPAPPSLSKFRILLLSSTVLL